MDIAQYILNLLNEHNEVSLPGIGTFFKRSVSAFYNEAEGIYYPPSNKIDFKGDEGSDSTLIQHIISDKHISESSAMYFVERFCENLKSSLEKDSRATISPLGVLVKKDNRYSLEDGGNQLGLEYFGLKPVKEPEQVNSSAAPLTTTQEYSETESETSASGSKSIFIILAVLLLLGAISALAYYFYPQYFKNLIPAADKKPAKKVTAPILTRDSIQDSVAFADTILKNLEQQGINGAEVEKAPDTLNITTKTTTVDSVKAKPKPEKVYEVIVASFGLKREAESSVRSLRRKGIDAKVITDKNKPKFKVSIGSFPTMGTANKEKRRVQEGVNKDAWILTVTNKEN
ncbi:MAG: SPOR domain-containing protein [Sphingobacteriaceae bacterium]|nr:SPOR domain-containing protein [Sphingobacteriaceae bacterium]